VVERTLALRRAGGSFGDELSTALAICTLLNFGVPPEELAGSAAFLAAAQQTDGSWPRIGAWGGQAMPANFGSAELTTGYCIEALARCAAIS
jgi:hypothetical protein